MQKYQKPQTEKKYWSQAINNVSLITLCIIYRVDLEWWICDYSLLPNEHKTAVTMFAQVSQEIADRYLVNHL